MLWLSSARHKYSVLCIEKRTGSFHIMASKPTSAAFPRIYNRHYSWLDGPSEGKAKMLPKIEECAAEVSGAKAHVKPVSPGCSSVMSPVTATSAVPNCFSTAIQCQRVPPRSPEKKLFDAPQLTLSHRHTKALLKVQEARIERKTLEAEVKRCEFRVRVWEKSKRADRLAGVGKQKRRYKKLEKASQRAKNYQLAHYIPMRWQIFNLSYVQFPVFDFQVVNWESLEPVGELGLQQSRGVCVALIHMLAGWTAKGWALNSRCKYANYGTTEVAMIKVEDEPLLNPSDIQHPTQALGPDLDEVNLHGASWINPPPSFHCPGSGWNFVVLAVPSNVPVFSQSASPVIVDDRMPVQSAQGRPLTADVAESRADASFSTFSTAISLDSASRATLMAPITLFPSPTASENQHVLTSDSSVRLFDAPMPSDQHVHSVVVSNRREALLNKAKAKKKVERFHRLMKKWENSNMGTREHRLRKIKTHIKHLQEARQALAHAQSVVDKWS
ncbi:hypothetical protein A0H81_14200 [Grifola frondosa]|uniref:Uncharacterized protein n=1 Tax=Grifola frondosa TaxID=5627 RepID=A0A1C7LMI2_GRIFR|nr:hypothetical protein A0H81_14200 [Grifola frondosa]